MLFLTGKRGANRTKSAKVWTAKKICSLSLTRSTPELPQGQVGERYCLAQQATAPSRAAQASKVADLARFFPDATPVRIPVQVWRRANDEADQPTARGVQESTVIEFGTPREVLFACATPLEFADVLHLRNSDGSLDAEASVVAVQYHPGTTAVAARFINSVPNWIIKP